MTWSRVLTHERKNDPRERRNNLLGRPSLGLKNHSRAAP
jgi:hypothetical protein